MCSAASTSRICYDGVMRYRYCARVMYDGSSFRGWQDQALPLAAGMDPRVDDIPVLDDDDSADGGEGGHSINGVASSTTDKKARWNPSIRTVQGTISKCISRRFNKQIRVVGAGRTDQGVSARGQAIHFDLPLELSEAEASNAMFTLNRMLPDDIRLYNLTMAPLGTPEQAMRDEPWHATASATGKLYVYRFCTNAYVDPLRRRHCAHLYVPTDLEVFERCLQLFVGTHDFRAFANRIEHTQKQFDGKNVELSTIKTVESVDLFDEGNGYYRVEVRLVGALYRMVRNIIGTSWEVAQGRLPSGLIESLLKDAPSRNANKAKSAPPEGLCLEHVFYDHY
jgi:tRNA pseudouridine38-40 synthase